jgi:hypothetical protein
MLMTGWLISPLFLAGLAVLYGCFLLLVSLNEHRDLRQQPLQDSFYHIWLDPGFHLVTASGIRLIFGKKVVSMTSLQMLLRDAAAFRFLHTVSSRFCRIPERVATLHAGFAETAFSRPPPRFS